MTAKITVTAALSPMGYVISGPNELAWVNNARQINRKCNTLARRNGFQPDDYEVIPVFAKVWKPKDGLTPAQISRLPYKRLPLAGWDLTFEEQAAEGARSSEAYLRHELKSLERAVTELGVKLYHRDDGSFARAELPEPTTT